MKYRCSIVLFILAALLPSLAAAAASQPATRVTTLTLADFGYPRDVTLNGVYPTFSFNIPVNRTLTAAKFDLRVHVSPLADPRSSVKVLVNGVPVLARYLSQIGHDALLSVPLPIPPRPQTSMQVTVKAYLYVTGDICYDLQTTDLFMTIESKSAVALTTEPMRGRGEIADFFTGYGSRINIVDQRAKSSADPGFQIVALPYALRQIERWHQPTITLGTKTDPKARNLVVRPGNTGYDAVHDTLYVDPKDLELVTSKAAPLLVVNGIKGGSSTVGVQTPSPDKRLTLSQLNIASQTASGLGEIAFEFPIEANRFGGMPTGMTFHMAYAQTPLMAGTTGMVRAELNGSLIASRTLSQDGHSDVWDIGIPASALAAANDLRITASYYTGPGSCRGNLPQLTMSILDSSYFSWTGTERNVDGITDFLKIANGNVGVFVGDDAMVPQTFHLMSELGRLNGAITNLHAEKFTGTVPAGYDYVFIVAAPNQLGTLKAPLRLDEAQFRIVNPLSNETLFGTTFEEPLGALEVAAADKTPALVLSYWNNPSVLAHFNAYGIDDLTQQVGNISLFDGSMQTYQVGEKLRVYYASGDLLTRIWGWVRLPLAILLVFLAIAFVIYAARRLTGGTRTS